MKTKQVLIFSALAALLCTASCISNTGSAASSRRTGMSLPDSVIVPTEDAVRMIHNYAPRAGVVIRDGDTLPGTRSITFGLTLLENYLTELRLQDVLGPIYPMASSSNSRSSLPIEITASNRYLPGG